MNKQGLIVEPKFEDANLYLQSGEMTKITENIKMLANKIDVETDGITLRKIIYWIQSNTVRLNSTQDGRKFRRTADEILISKERTGCCDTATLFTAIARAKQIPTMEIITLSKQWGEKLEKGITRGTEGHFFTASYIKDINNNHSWVLIDPDKKITDLRDVRIEHLNTADRNISNNYYAFAYVRDYRDIIIDNLKIDSIQNIGEIQRMAYKACDRKDFKSREDYER